jgi:hypothetical protein
MINRRIEQYGNQYGNAVAASEAARQEFITEITNICKRNARFTVEELGRRGYVCFDPEIMFTHDLIGEDVAGWRLKAIYCGSWFGLVKMHWANWLGEMERELRALWYRVKYRGGR